MEIASKGKNESNETIATMKDRSKEPTIVTNISQETKEQNKDQTKHPISRDEEKGEEEWKRVGRNTTVTSCDQHDQPRPRWTNRGKPILSTMNWSEIGQREKTHRKQGVKETKKEKRINYTKTTKEI